MAYEYKFNDEDDDKTGQPPESANSAPLGGTGALGAQASPGIQTRPTTPSGRPNAQQYLQANQGAGANLASGIEKTVSGQAAKVQSGIDSARNQLNSSSRPLETSLGSQAQTNINQAFQNPADILKQKNQLAEFTKLRDQGYAGDINALGANQAAANQANQAQVNQLGQTTGLGNTEAGRYQLLRQSFGQPNYTTGQQRLDQLFLQAQPGVNRGLQNNLADTQKHVLNGYSSLGTDTQAKLDALNAMSKGNSKAISNLFLNGNTTNPNQLGIRGIESDAQQRYAADQARAAQLPDILARIKNNTVTQEDLQTLGAGKDLSIGQSLYDVDLSNYINQAAPSETLAQAVTPEEFARYNALQQLANNPTQNVFGTATQAGGYDPYGFRGAEFGNQLNQVRTNYEQTRPQELLQSFMNTITGRRSAMEGADKGDYRSARNPEVWNPMIKELQPLLQNLNQVDANTLLTSLNQGFSHMAPGLGNSLEGYLNHTRAIGGSDSAANELQNYFNTLNQLRGNQLGTKNLPTKDDGTIDWSKLPTPGGK